MAHPPPPPGTLSDAPDGRGDSAAPGGPFPFLSPPRAAGELGRLGPYRVLGVLGQGGMGVVFRAEDPALRRQVALKVMLPRFAADPVAKARFVREARAQAAVEHEHVVAIYQVGEDRGVPFLAMPLLKGMPLSAAVKSGLLAPVPEAVRIVREMAEGLSAAHDKGLIHRDIKPANVWLDGPGRRVKILDFGLAREADAGDAGEPVTASGAILGTPAYMSPEQANGKPLDFRSDLFSLGTVLYELLTGHRPFRGESNLTLMMAVAHLTPPPPSGLNPGVPPVLDGVVGWLMAKDPAGRPPTAAAAADALRAVEADLGRTHVMLPAGSAAEPDPWTGLDAGAAGGSETVSYRSGHVSGSPRPGPTRGPGGAGTLRLVGLGLAGLLTLGGGFLALKILNPHPAEVAATPPADPRPVPTRAKATRRVPPGGEKPAPDAARTAAEYVLSIGGKVRVDEQDEEIDSANGLPRGAFRLTGVNLENNDRATDEGLACFAGCKDLVHLDLYHAVNVHDAGLAHFEDCKNLTTLRLGFTDSVTDAGLAHFQDCKRLTVLNLYLMPITDAGLKHFGGCKNLTLLNLGNTAVTDDGLAIFKDCHDLTHLHLLLATRVTDAGLAHFQDCKGLLALNLSATRVTDAGMPTLRNFPRLNQLYLERLPISDTGLEHARTLKDLQHAHLRDTKVTADGVAALKAAVPRCWVEWDGGVLKPTYTKP